ncbi:MAG: hypothetical protein WBO55_11405 [Rhizobiaceae bacterium]
MLRIVLGLIVLGLTAGTSLAQSRWTAELIEKPKLPAEIVPEARKAAPGNFAHMLTAVAETGDVSAAWYSQPTNRYAHGVLGDRTEGGALVVQRSNGRKLTYRLEPYEVFEDIAPRIADLDRDGRSEVVTILSSLAEGASIAIFEISGDTLRKVVSTPFIGRPNRWLNIAAIAPFARGGGQQIAFVATPHIGGKLGFLGYLNGRLTMLGAAQGYSNHVIGSTELRLAAAADTDGDGVAELALPSNDRKSLIIAALTQSGVRNIASVSLPSPIDKAIATSGSGQTTTFTVGLENGKVYTIARK